MTDKHIELHVGQNFDDVAKRVKSAWVRAENGEDVNENHISFVSWDLFGKVIAAGEFPLPPGEG